MANGECSPKQQINERQFFFPLLECLTEGKSLCKNSKVLQWSSRMVDLGGHYRGFIDHKSRLGASHYNRQFRVNIFRFYVNNLDNVISKIFPFIKLRKPCLLFLNGGFYFKEFA